MYLSLGPTRSLTVAAKKLGKSRRMMEKWSRRFDWPARVQAHGAHMAQTAREAAEALARAKGVDWLKRQEEIREQEWEMHEKCIEAAKRALASFMAREKIYANLADISRILEVASKLGRLASGMACDRTEVTGEGGGPVRVELEVALKKIYGPASAEATARQAGAVDVEAVVALPEGKV